MQLSCVFLSTDREAAIGGGMKLLRGAWSQAVFCCTREEVSVVILIPVQVTVPRTGKFFDHGPSECAQVPHIEPNLVSYHVSVGKLSKYYLFRILNQEGRLSLFCFPCLADVLCQLIFYSPFDFCVMGVVFSLGQNI